MKHSAGLLNEFLVHHQSLSVGQMAAPSHVAGIVSRGTDNLPHLDHWLNHNGVAPKGTAVGV